MRLSTRRWPKDAFVREAYRTLNRLGISANHTGFHYISYGVTLIAEDPTYLLLVTKRLYPDIARQYGTSWHRVERDIRTAITLAWNTNPLLMESLAGRGLCRRPQPTQFLSDLTTYLLSAETAPQTTELLRESI